MSPRSQVTAALASAYVIVFLSQRWIADVRDWVYGVTGRTPRGAAAVSPDDAAAPQALPPTGRQGDAGGVHVPGVTRPNPVIPGGPPIQTLPGSPYG